MDFVVSVRLQRLLRLQRTQSPTPHRKVRLVRGDVLILALVHKQEVHLILMEAPSPKAGILFEILVGLIRYRRIVSGKAYPDMRIERSLLLGGRPYLDGDAWANAGLSLWCPSS